METMIHIVVARGCPTVMHAFGVLDDCSAVKHAFLVLDDCSAVMHAILAPDHRKEAITKASFLGGPLGRSVSWSPCLRERSEPPGWIPFGVVFGRTPGRKGDYRECLFKALFIMLCNMRSGLKRLIPS